MHTVSAHHGDGVVALFRQVGDGECSHVVTHGDEAEPAAGTRVAIEDQSDSFDLSIRRKEGIEVGFADVVACV